MEAIERLRFLAPGTGEREGGEKTQIFNRFPPHRVSSYWRRSRSLKGNIWPICVGALGHIGGGQRVIHEVPSGRILPRLPGGHLFQKRHQFHSNLKFSSDVNKRPSERWLRERGRATYAAIDLLSLFALLLSLLLHLFLHVFCFDVFNLISALARIRRTAPTLEIN